MMMGELTGKTGISLPDRLINGEVLGRGRNRVDTEIQAEISRAMMLVQDAHENAFHSRVTKTADHR